MSDSDCETRIDKKLRRLYSVQLMNNTKWREVWSLIAKLSLRLSMKYADDPNWQSNALWGPFRLDDVQENGIRDPGVGGPFLFKQILSIRIPKTFQNDTEAFAAAIGKLGDLPVSETDEYIEILAYR